MMIEYCFSEAIEAGQSLLDLEKARRDLEAEGVPALCHFELTRQVLDEDLLESKEIFVCEGSNEDE
jgi:hypothetical protein